MWVVVTMAATAKNGNENAAFFFSFLLALQFGLQPILANWSSLLTLPSFSTSPGADTALLL